MKNNLENHPDWIVLNNSMETLALWAHDDPELKKWLLPQLTALQAKRVNQLRDERQNF